MIEKLGIEPQVAIDRFEAGRGYAFDHPEYPEDLRRLKPTVDPKAVAWHSTGVRIQSAVIVVEEVDMEAVMSRGKQAPEPPEKCVF